MHTEPDALSVLYPFGELVLVRWAGIWANTAGSRQGRRMRSFLGVTTFNDELLSFAEYRDIQNCQSERSEESAVLPTLKEPRVSRANARNDNLLDPLATGKRNRVTVTCTPQEQRRHESNSPRRTEKGIGSG